jgi:putative restriction endonuclease
LSAAAESALEQGREARFRIRIVSAYQYTCALTGYRLTTVRAGSIVDAAHIHQFADSRNNALDNGIALSKNAHWLFDQGLWTISDSLTVIVAEGKFAERRIDGVGLASQHGKRLHLPEDKNLWPNPIHLAWHRENRFLR